MSDQGANETAAHGDGATADAGGATTGPGRLDLLKALGDNTRYAIYLELARSVVPLATAEIAATLDLHPNTVRPHLERMRDVGLLDVSVDHRGGPGRPQHRYALAPDAPSLGLEPSAWPLLARLLLQAAANAGATGDDAAEAGRAQGVADAALLPPRDQRRSCADVLSEALARLGFDPERVDGEGFSTIAFARCPFRDLAEAHPDLVCALHRGMVEGFVAARGDAAVVEFATLVDRDPCRVTVVGDSPLPVPARG